MAAIRILSSLIIDPVNFNDGVKINANKYAKFIDNVDKVVPWKNGCNNINLGE